MMKTYQCQSCGSDFESKKGCRSRTPKYCSSKCFGKTLELIIECKLCGVRIENKHSAKISNRIYCSKECQGKAARGKTLSDEWRKALSEGRKASDKCKGENLYNWKGGIENTRRLNMENAARRKYQVIGKLPVEFLTKAFEAQNGQCFYCDTSLAEYKAIEHLTPLKRGGDNKPWNLVYSCKSCNSKKRTLTLEEFAIKHNRYDWLNKSDNIYAAAID
jgi:5-methylcytosine-specific restriction endonuclease McrA